MRDLNPVQVKEMAEEVLSGAKHMAAIVDDLLNTSRIEQGNLSLECRQKDIGIPRDKLPRVFEKFYRVPNDLMHKVPGNGLGLSVSKSIVEAHGGEIWIKARRTWARVSTSRCPSSAARLR